MAATRKWIALGVCVASGMATWHAGAQANLSALESAYIFNFAEFTKWPDSRTPSRQLEVCASAQSPLRDGLAALNGRAVGSLVWHFRALTEKTAQAGCGVLVLNGRDDINADVREVIESDRPVLIVAESGVGTAGAYVIRLVEEDNHLKFDVDNTEAARRHLTLSSKLLRLARRIM